MTPQVIAAALVGACLFGWFANEKTEAKKGGETPPGEAPKKSAETRR